MTLLRRSFWVLLCPIVITPALRGAPSETDRRPMLVINEDNSHFFGSRPPEEMTLAGLQRWVDAYAGSAVTHLFLCPNAMRASFRSQTRDAIWDPVHGVEPKELWPANAKRLHLAGLDPYSVWIARCRERGLSPWLSMRMNDVHSVNEPDNFMHSTFWREHPEWRRTSGPPVAPWANFALNYAHPEVRAHALSFVRELLERYDPDGLELDWMRFGRHLTPGREREEGTILDDFMQQVRALTQAWSAKRGHPVQLGVRVPAHPDAARGLGMDACRWSQNGWIDLLVPTPFWTSSDFDIPIETWREQLGPAAAHVRLLPGLEYNSRPWPGGKSVPNDVPVARGFAASAWARGADGLYLFNWMDSQTRPVSEEAYAELMRTGLSLTAIRGQPRRYLITYRDTVPPSFSNNAQLPAKIHDPHTFRLHAGSIRDVSEAWIIVGLSDRHRAETPGLAATLNGQALPRPQPVEATSLGGAQTGLRFPCPPEALRDGWNEITLEARQATEAAHPEVVWLELSVTGK